MFLQYNYRFYLTHQLTLKNALAVIFSSRI